MTPPDNQNDHPESQDTATTETFEFGVEGAEPAEHACKVKELLQDTEGVRSVEPHLTEQRVEVTYDPTRTNPAAIHQLLQDKGYHASRWADN